jgi:predicted GNAT family acetyltransferase
MQDLEITRHGTSQSGEYRARLAGSTAIGRLTWTARGDVRIAEHTLVPREIGGRGIAARLVEALVADARNQHFTIDPQCSYVAAQFDRHADWADLRASGR